MYVGVSRQEIPESLRHDARADYRGEEKGSSDSFRSQSPGKRHGLISFCCMFTRAQKERLSSESLQNIIAQANILSHA